jgi:hypothetical protein
MSSDNTELAALLRRAFSRVESGVEKWKEFGEHDRLLRERERLLKSHSYRTKTRRALNRGRSTKTKNSKKRAARAKRRNTAIYYSKLATAYGNNPPKGMKLKRIKAN